MPHSTDAVEAVVHNLILSGHCPYWWIQETEIYPNHSSPCLEQIPTPCETGPGSLIDLESAILPASPKEDHRVSPLLD
eukprot:XP_017447650.1 PREDICTED: glucose-6-phosphatase 2-like [Rattus norvegicus]